MSPGKGVYGMKKARILVIILLTMCFVAGCTKEKGITSGKGTYNPDENEEISQDKGSDSTTDRETLFVLMQIDDQEKRLLLQRADDKGQQYYYQYDDYTKVYDKYKKIKEFSSLEPGDVVVLSTDSKKKKVLSLTMAKHVWQMDQITDLTVKANGEVASFKGKNYAWSDQIGIFWDHQQMTLEELTRMDILKVIGVDRRILAVKVETGHGTVTFQNADKFVGGYALFGNVLAVQIQKDMIIPVRSGTMLFSVMKDGIGGSKEVTLEENQNLTIDLEAFANETIQKGQITFRLLQEDAKLYINGELVDITKPIELSYGGYQIKVKSDQYDSWTRTLMVGSKSSTIVIDLDEIEEAKKSSTDTSKTNTGSSTGNSTGSKTNTGTSTSVNTNTGSTITNGTTTNNSTGKTDAATSTSSTKLIDDILNALLGVKEQSATKTNN